MTTVWLTAVVLSPVLAGFLYLFYRQLRDYGPPIPLTRSMGLALMALLALYGCMVAVDWANPLDAWLQSAASAAANKMLPAVWAVFGLPLWATSIILCPNAARDLCAASQILGAAPLRFFGVLGWTLLAFSWSLFGVLTWIET